MPKLKRGGECWSTALKEMLKPGGPNYTLVHGIPLGRSGEAEGLNYPHAWLETASHVWDSSLFERGVNPWVDKHLYYLLGNIKWSKRYTLTEARRMMLRKDTYGPWHKKLLNLDKRLDRGMMK